MDPNTYVIGADFSGDRPSRFQNVFTHRPRCLRVPVTLQHVFLTPTSLVLVALTSPQRRYITATAVCRRNAHLIQPRQSLGRICPYLRLCMRYHKTPSGHAIPPQYRDATVHTTTFSIRCFHICSPSAPRQDSLHSRISSMCRCTFVELQHRQRDDKVLYRNVVAGICMVKIWKTTHQ